ncbi:MAG: AtpZ/AtpI family protein [Bacteroidia bacterium]|nr:AtpZ/AtpI family protein [Bacteroidia bacterium]
MLSEEVAEKERRKLKALKDNKRSVWFGLGMMGIVGWSVVVPTLLGAGLGIWLDNKYPGTMSWTLTCLIIGLFAGCLVAWHWVSKEHKEMYQENKKEDE